jgi:CO/xanthine dehydrogenase Mo-binding subunit
VRRRATTARQAERQRAISLVQVGRSEARTRAPVMRTTASSNPILMAGEAARDMARVSASEMPSHFRAWLHTPAQATRRHVVQFERGDFRNENGA